MPSGGVDQLCKRRSWLSFNFHPCVILRKRSPSQGEGLPAKDLCIADDSSAKALPDPVMHFRNGFAPTLHVRAARNAQVLHLLSSRFVGRKTAFRMTALRCRGWWGEPDQTDPLTTSQLRN